MPAPRRPSAATETIAAVNQLVTAGWDRLGAIRELRTLAADDIMETVRQGGRPTGRQVRRWRLCADTYAHSAQLANGAAIPQRPTA